MKWSSALLLAATAILWNACEMHPAAELPREEGVGERLPDPVKAESEPTPDAGPPEAAKPAPVAGSPAEVKRTEAPKFFPEKNPEKK